MKKGMIKLCLLGVFAIIGCYFIYYYVDRAKPVTEIKSILETQATKEATFLSDSAQYTFEKPKIILNPYGNSPLTALIIFETTDLTTPTLTVVGKTEKTSITHTFTPSKLHVLPVYGLYPDTQNEIHLTINGKTNTFQIKTEKLPKNFVTATVTKRDEKALVNNQFYFFTPSSTGYTCAYDIAGDVRWYLTDHMLWDIKTLKNGNLLLSSNRLVNPPYYTSGLYEMDFTGKIYYEYRLPGGYHHDVYEMENGNLLVASDNFKNGTVEDYIVELDRKTGNIIKTFDLTKILPMEEGHNLNTTDYDWFHNNAVWYDKSTNSISLSGRHQDIILNIDYTTQEINWILGDPTNWSKEMQKYFLKPIGNVEWQYGQHAVEILPNKDVFLFDNGNNRSKTEEGKIPAEQNYSRAVIYRVNKEKMTVEQIWQYGKERGSSFYSPYISDVDYLAPNHYLILSGGISYTDGKINNEPAGLTKVDRLQSILVEYQNDHPILEMTMETNYYRAEKMSFYEKNQFSIRTGIVLGNFEKTETSSHNPLLLWKHKIDKEYQNRQIQITKEFDRLVVTGTFKKDDKVQIILDNTFDKKTYDVRISKKPYTAMCIDIFNKQEEENGISVTKYINDVGLKGKYYIYLKMNQKIYDTDLYITY